MITRSILLFSTAASALLGMTPAMSADTAAPAADQSAPSDIIVTAQKREQTLIDVPQSISVISGATLDLQQASSFQDYLKLVPGLQLNQSQPGTSRLILRGLNTGGVASTVAVYVDETPFGSSSGQVNGAILSSDFDTFDVARIEVLRGPQGTLYGANSLGGLLKFVTNEPELGKFGGKVRGGVETTDGGQIGYSGNAVVNIPLGETLAFRASGYYHRYGGYIDSIGTAAVIPTPTAADPAATTTLASANAKNINSSRTYGGRASLLFKPSDAFKLRLSAILQNIDAHAPDTVESNPVTLAELYGSHTQSQFVPEHRNTASRLYNATADLDVGFATLTSSTSYGTLDQHILYDETVYLNEALGGALGTPYFSEPQLTQQHKFTQELRLASSKSSFISWLVGGYYTHETGKIVQDYNALTPGSLAPVAGLPLLAHVELPSTYNEVAGFANGTIYFSPKFDLTLGGRYSHNWQHADETAEGILATAGGALVTYPQTRSSDNVFTFSASPKFNFSKHASLYGRVAKGYRPGGPNPLPAEASAVPRTYRSDSVMSYEVGLKAETADHTLSIDVDAFHIDWKHIQLLTIVGAYGVNANGGKAQSDGGEFTITAKPTPGLTFVANGAITHARLKEDSGILSGGLAGDALPYSPKYSVNLDGQYEWAMGDGIKPYVGASLRFLSKQNGDYDYFYRVTYGHQRQIPSYEVVDLRAGADFGRFNLEVYAKNVNNALGRTSVASTAFAANNVPDGNLAVAILRPRTVGVSLTAGF